ncbi:DUF5134 domain-containing protein [Streptomyces sulfonofaciens]|uniref:DUF5134 domain-containing protein n=1 Tax=Streptomyces sulfonofaciens TaxID=68272 RepID=A0A919FTK0_9ACTN|nr:DUF5134 domain-containing protein [Streptomyces sulfonofaciens]GHH72227.1 DUF5134 domain-containing protein [Streptomyces sulfonofaciens]
MHGPVSAAWLVVAVCAGSGAYCLLRMRSAVPGQRHTAGGDALMGLGMAAMAVPAAVLTPPRQAWLACAAVFAAAALHAAWSARRDHRHLHHLIGSCAMVYMSAVMASMPPMPDAHTGHGGAGTPALTGPLLLYFAGYALWAGVRLLPAAAPVAAVPVRAGSTPAPAWTDRPELARACRLCMSVGMLAMLLAM